jgi:antitoxin YefM
MLVVNFSTAQENFEVLCNRVNEEVETIVIARKRGGNVVMLSETEYNNMQENLFVRRDKKAYARLIKSIEQLNPDGSI